MYFFLSTNDNKNKQCFTGVEYWMPEIKLKLVAQIAVKPVAHDTQFYINIQT